MKNIAKLVLIGLMLVGIVTSASGQTGGSYDLSWNTIASGGATFSVGGTYSLGSSVGQPDATAPLSGGVYTLTGGFWAIPPFTQVFLPMVKR